MRLLLVIILFSLVRVASAQSVFVPLDHQVYSLLMKGETLGMFGSYNMRSLPMSRTEIRNAITAMHEQTSRLSSADALFVEQMLGEFTDPQIGEAEPPESEIHLYRYDEGSAQIFVDVRAVGALRTLGGRLDIPDETLGEFTGWGSVRGRVGEHVVFALSAYNRGVFGGSDTEERFDPGQGQTQVVVGKGVFSDQATGYVGINYGVFHFAAGRTELSWGSGLSDRLALSTRNEPMDQIRFSLDFEKFRFSYVHANLEGLGDSRFLAGHRLDFLLNEAVQLGLFETVVYAGRGAELGYINPLVPYHIIEHQLGDKDNNTLGVDASVLFAPGVRGYTEIFVDDFSLDYPLGTYWGNKLAYLAGVHWAQPFGWKEAELSVSYTRVDPYVYTHQDSINVYAHYGASIGSRLGPNAERFQAGVSVRPVRDLYLNLEYALVRKGRGDIFTPHRAEDGDGKGYLSGVVERQYLFALSARYQIHRDLFIGLDVSLLSRANVLNMSAINADEKTIQLFLDVNY